MKKNPAQPSLPFSNKYSATHAKDYFEKHNDGFWRKLSNWRDHCIAEKALALADNPKNVLDIPCGTGRFWALLAKQPDRTIHACDYSQNMIDTALQHRPAEIVQRINAFQGSAFALPVPDNFTDTVFCIRLIHHIGEHEDRLKLLTELQRVTSSTIIISLWVDGNVKSWRRKRLEARRGKRAYQNRFVIPAKQIESEFASLGLSVEAKLDFMPFFSMWRTYILKKSKRC